MYFVYIMNYMRSWCFGCNRFVSSDLGRLDNIVVTVYFVSAGLVWHNLVRSFLIWIPRHARTHSSITLVSSHSVHASYIHTNIFSMKLAQLLNPCSFTRSTIPSRTSPNDIDFLCTIYSGNEERWKYLSHIVGSHRLCWLENNGDKWKRECERVPLLWKQPNYMQCNLFIISLLVFGFSVFRISYTAMDQHNWHGTMINFGVSCNQFGWFPFGKIELRIRLVVLKLSPLKFPFRDLG